MGTLFSNINTISTALGWTLLHFLWQGLVIFAAYWIITRLFFKDNFSLKYWSGIFFIILSLFFPIREFLIQLNLNSLNDLNTFYQSHSNILLLETNGILSSTDIILMLIQKSLPYLVAIWLFVILLISINLTKSWFKLLKLSNNTGFHIPEKLINFLNAKSKQLNLKFKPVISVSQKIIIPATFGFFRPVVLFPAAMLSRLPQEQIEAIILHELCHIKRADFIHNILQLLVETLFFYHPLIKWMSSDIRKTREQCCDELVLKLDTNPLVYAKALTNVASLINSQSKVESSYIQITATDGELFNRIKFLMMIKKPTFPLPFLFIGFISLLVLFIAIQNFDANRPTNDFVSKNDMSYFKPEDSIDTSRPFYSIPDIGTMKKKEEHRTKKHETKKNVTIKSSKIIEETSATYTSSKLNTLNPVNLFTQNNAPIKRDKQSQQIFQKTKDIKAAIEPSSSNPLIENSPNNTLSFKLPKIIKKVMPNYNRTAKLLGVEGTVILSFRINKHGKVKDIRMDKNSKLQHLSYISKQALRLWRFDKKSLDLNNISYRYQQVFQFNLEDSPVDCKRAIRTGSRIPKMTCI